MEQRMREMLLKMRDDIVSVGLPDWDKMIIHATMDENNSGIGVYIHHLGEYKMVDVLAEEGIVDEGAFTMQQFAMLDDFDAIFEMMDEEHVERWNTLLVIFSPFEILELKYEKLCLDDPSENVRRHKEVVKSVLGWDV